MEESVLKLKFTPWLSHINNKVPKEMSLCSSFSQSDGGSMAFPCALMSHYLVISVSAKGHKIHPLLQLTVCQYKMMLVGGLSSVHLQ